EASYLGPKFKALTLLYAPGIEGSSIDHQLTVRLPMDRMNLYGWFTVLLPADVLRVKSSPGGAWPMGIATTQDVVPSYHEENCCSLLSVSTIVFEVPSVMDLMAVPSLVALAIGTITPLGASALRGIILRVEGLPMQPKCVAAMAL